MNAIILWNALIRVFAGKEPAGLMNKIPAQKYPKEGILRESTGAARGYEIKMVQEVRKNVTFSWKL